MFKIIVRSVVCLLIAGVLLSNSSYGSTANWPKDVMSALNEAGDNCSELEKVLSHFENDTDTLKFIAACFLIENMAGHSFVTYDLIDTTGAVVPFNPLSYPNYDSLLLSVGEIEKERGEIDYRRNKATEDLKTITAEYLIDNIDMAFDIWRTRPWAKKMPFEIFCNNVLPYRGSNEPLEDWRSEFIKKHEDLATMMNDQTDPIEAAEIINKEVMTWFTFDPRFYYHPTDQSLSEMKQNGVGRCEDMTNAAIYALRANGIAVTSDYTPYWADAGNNHAWNAVVMPDGSAIPFMGAEASPGKYSLANRVAKVYRKTFAQQKNSLAAIKPDSLKVPRWLGRKSAIDVTKAYTEVSDVTILLHEAVPDSVPYAYIAVFNSGEWQAIHYGVIDDQQVTFTDMGRDIVYLPMFYLNEKLVPASEPFILTVDGTINFLIPSSDTVSVELRSTTKKKLVQSTDGIMQSLLESGREYTLFYWKDGWQTAGEKVAGDKPLKYNVPSNGLYWLVAKDSDREERVFVVENGKQVWY